jgi:hypothetical protein
VRKLAYQLGDDLNEESPRRARWPRVLLIMILVAGLCPLLLDGAAISLGHWKEYLGVSANVSTPTLDRVAESLNDLNRGLWGWVTPWFHSLPWQPNVVIPTAIIVMAAAMLMLRR